MHHLRLLTVFTLAAFSTSASAMDAASVSSSAYFSLAVTAVLSALTLSASHWLLIKRHTDLGSEAMLPRQMIMLLLSLVAVVSIVMSAPLPEGTRNQVIGLLGILFSGVVAFSSTSFVTNFMAALMLRVTRPFQVGDFITIGDHFGKVTQRGIFDTEIQTTNRDLIAIPNSAFVSRSVTVVRNSGTIISANVSLGYDLAHQELEPLLKQAAESAGLQDPFVHVVELGDFSVSYRVSGLLTDLTRLLTAKSALNRAVLDALHINRIEIASPNLIRQVTPEDQIIPVVSQPIAEEAGQAEAVVFDKANEIQELETERQSLKQELKTGVASHLEPDIVDKIKVLDKQIADKQGDA